MSLPGASVTERILACAFEVHARMGPGFLESTYRACLEHRLKREGIKVESEVPIAIVFDEITLPTGYRADLIVEDLVLVELKSVDRILSIHISQTLTYLKHAQLDLALLLNFNVQSLKDGIRRFDNRSIRRGRTPPTPPTRSSSL